MSLGQQEQAKHAKECGAQEREVQSPIPRTLQQIL